MDKKEYQRQYYQRNKAKIKAKSAQWKKDNPEKWEKYIKQYLPEWKEGNEDKCDEYIEKYRKTEKYKENHRNYYREYQRNNE